MTNAPQRAQIAIQGTLPGASVQAPVVMLLEPVLEAGVEIVQPGEGAQRKEREKGPAHGFKEALDFASGRGVVGSRVDQGHAQAGPGEREQTAGERGAIVTIQDLGQAMASEGFLEGGPLPRPSRISGSRDFPEPKRALP